MSDPTPNARDVTNPARPPAALPFAGNSPRHGLPGAAGNPSSREERNAAILKALRTTDRTLADIGREFGLSTARLSVLANAHGLGFANRPFCSPSLRDTPSIVAALRDTDLSLRDIGRQHGLSHEWVAKIGREAGVDVTKRGKRLATAAQTELQSETTDRWVGRAIKLRADGASIKSIADEVGVSAQNVSARLIAADLRTVPYRSRSK